MKNLRLGNLVQIYFKWSLFRIISTYKEDCWSGKEWTKREGYVIKHLLGTTLYPYLAPSTLLRINKECSIFKYKDLVLIVKFKVSLGKWFKKKPKSNAAIEAVWNLHKVNTNDQESEIIKILNNK